MKLSIIIPAYNEERLLGACLRSVRQAASACAIDAELIVCDNNSTDATPRVAREEGARVVFEPHNQISRARNAGARASSGDWLLFVDADSLLHSETLAETLETIATGRFAGGGCVIAFDVDTWWVRATVASWNVVSRAFRWAAGSYVFCRSDAFRAVGGFSEEVYAGEELFLSRALRRWGRSRGLGFAILRRHPHLSSGRKAALYGGRELLGIALRGLVSPMGSLKRKDVMYLFYDGRR